MPQVRQLLASGALIVAGCAYDPPMRADHHASAYRTDLAVCQEAGSKEADRRVLASGLLFLTYPVSQPVQTRIATRKCMEGKGYELAE